MKGKLMSRNRTFSGMCIGGPRAGHEMKCDAPTRCVPERLSATKNYSADTCPEDVSVEIRHRVYRYDEIECPEGKIGLWIADGATAHEALKHILAIYRDAYTRHL